MKANPNQMSKKSELKHERNGRIQFQEKFVSSNYGIIQVTIAFYCPLVGMKKSTTKSVLKFGSQKSASISFMLLEVRDDLSTSFGPS
jgi:hypothetical protein